MGQLRAKLRSTADGVAFWCPGCRESHHIKRSIWQWDGNVDRPTFSPSVLVTSGHYKSGHSGRCWCDYNREHPDDPAVFGCSRCHSFVRDGRIQFLSDCTHWLANQTVDVPDLPSHMQDGDV